MTTRSPLRDVACVLTLFAYCGMRVPLAAGDAGVCRAVASRRIRRHLRRDKPVHTLEPGSRWELGTPDSAFMVGDDEGILELEPAPPEPACEPDDDPLD